MSSLWFSCSSTTSSLIARPKHISQSQRRVAKRWVVGSPPTWGSHQPSGIGNAFMTSRDIPIGYRWAWYRGCLPTMVRDIYPMYIVNILMYPIVEQVAISSPTTIHEHPTLQELGEILYLSVLIPLGRPFEIPDHGYFLALPHCAVEDVTSLADFCTISMKVTLNNPKPWWFDMIW